MTAGLLTGLKTGIRPGLAAGLSASAVARSGGAVIDGLILFVGQSNEPVGQGNSNNLDNAVYGGIGHLVNVAVPTDSRVKISNHYATTIADPLTWFDPDGVAAFRDLQQYAAAGSPGMGAELAFGRYMADTNAMVQPIYLAKFGVNGLDMGRLIPGSGFPVNGGELFTQLTTHITALQTASGKSLAVLVIGQGESDANSDANAAAYQGKLETFTGAIWALHPNALIVIRRLSDNQIGGLTGAMTAPRVATVQAAQDAVAAANPTKCMVVNSNRVPTIASGKEHFSTDGYWMDGNILASEILARIKPAQSDSQGSGSAPWIQMFREPSNGNDSSNGNITIYPQTKSPSGDLELLFGMHASSTSQNALPALTTANGFASTGHGTAQSIFAATTIVSVAAFSRAATGSVPLTAVLTDLVTRKRGWTMSIRNTSGIDVQAVTGDNLNNLLHTINGVTTTADNCRVIFIVAYFSGSPAAVSSFTCAGLTGVTIHRNSFRNHNGSASQDACKFAVMSGIKATAGATGTAVFTTGTTATVAAALCIAFKP